jgi:hypothetical protein
MICHDNNTTVLFELFNVKTISDNINWENKTITINNRIEHTNVIFENYLFNNNSTTSFIIKTDLYKQQSVISWKSLIDLWNSYILEYTKYIKNYIKFTILSLGTDYYIAPIYITKNITILGIFIFDNQNTNSHTDNIIKKDVFGFLSTIKPIGNIKEIDKNKFNICSGILNFRNHNNKYFNTQFENKMITRNIPGTIIEINWKIILSNIRNYIPKLDIIYK